MKIRVFLSIFSLFLTIAVLNAQEDKAGKIVTDYYAWVDAGNFDAIGGLLTDDFSSVAPFSPMPFDKKSWRSVGEGFKAAFPDMKHEITNWFAKGNSVAVQAVFKGENTGPMMGNPPTGNSANLSFTAIFTLDGKGKIKSLDTRFDQKDFEAQLMAGLPPMNKATPVVNQIYAAFGKGDLQGILAVCADNVQWVDAGAAVGNLYKGKRMGKQGVTEFFTDLNNALTITQFEPREFLPSGGNKMTVKGFVAGTAKNTGKAYASDWTMLFEVNDAGKLVYHQLFLDTDNVGKALTGSKQ